MVNTKTRYLLYDQTYKDATHADRLADDFKPHVQQYTLPAKGGVVNNPLNVIVGQFVAGSSTRYAQSGAATISSFPYAYCFCPINIDTIDL